nr:hypothetical protein [Tanacetum cinerariifolium]
MMQRLLPYGLKQYLAPNIAKPLIELCLFFKQICSQTLMVDDMLKAQSKVIDILCNLELIYPPDFFDIMIHLVIHLPLEAIFGGPICPRNELFALAYGPSQTPISVNSCVVNGVRFDVHSHDECRITQNSGICSPGPDGEMYYGQLEQILEFSYLSFKNVLFQVAFKNDQYILATQVKQCFYLEDMARPPLGWKVVEHVSHKKFLNGGVIVVEDDPDVIHVDNSSDLALSTSLNDLEITALHIDGQLIDVDAPPDIIDVADEDDDIIDEEDPIPYDLADSDDEDLVNLDIDDGVNMSADVALGHGGDSGGDDRPPPYQVRTPESPIWVAGERAGCIPAKRPGTSG